MPRRKEPRIPDAVLDQLLADADPQAVFDPNGLLDTLKKALAERVLNAEMDHHLAGAEPYFGRPEPGISTVAERLVRQGNRSRAQDQPEDRSPACSGHFSHDGGPLQARIAGQLHSD